jgi:hypothetical protein
MKVRDFRPRNLTIDLEVKFSTREQLPAWLHWESDAVLVGTPPAPNDNEAYKESIILTATYNAFGMTHVIESRLEVDIRSPSDGDLAPSLGGSNVQRPPMTNTGMESGMEAYLDDDDDDMMFMGQHAFSSETNTPPSAIAPSGGHQAGLLYIPSHSLQNSPLKQSSMGPTPPATGPPLSTMSLNPPQPLTPNQSPAPLHFNQNVVASSRQPSSTPQTPLGGPRTNLSLHIPHHQEMSSLSTQQNQHSHFRYMNDVQPSIMYGIQNQMRLSPPTSADSNGRIGYIDGELGDDGTGHGYFDDSYPLELGSPFLER